MLSQFFEDRLVSISPQEIGDRLTLLGIELDEIEGLNFSFEGVVIARVESTQPHPNADKLTLAEVFDGIQTVQVVCGAANCRPGVLIPFARVGASLRGKNAAGVEETWEIKKAKLRGSDSFGMLCAQDELGLETTMEGIFELPSDAPVGMDFRDYLADPILVVSLTPNLGHCMSVLGIARELAASLGKKVILPTIKLHETKEENPLHVQIDTPACQSISFRVVEKVSSISSPAWLQSALLKLGQKPHNIAVDIANYTMFMLGQPLHMYDLEQLGSNKISVTSNTHVVGFHGLNDKNYMIPSDPILIESAGHILGLAGLMGGFTSRVTETTKRIAIEAACFDPVAIRAMSKHLHLRTESSARFEKGIDPGMTLFALDFAAMLLVESSEGSLSKGVISAGALQPSKRVISLRTSRVNHLLGSKLSHTEVAELLSRLEIQTKEVGESFQCQIPTYRNDLKEEIDLVEEVARLYGFENLRQENIEHPSSSSPNDPMYDLQVSAINTLIQLGLQQCITCDLISPEMSKLTLEKHFSPAQVIEVLHPSSSDQSILRVSLLPGLLDVVHRNLMQGAKDLALFEVGRTHFNENGVYEEHEMASICLAGQNAPQHVTSKAKPFDFYDLKASIEDLVHRLTGKSVAFEESHLSNFHPFRQARVFIDKDLIGSIGEVHPALLQKFDINVPVLFGETSLLKIAQHQTRALKAEPLWSFPGTTRDWTVCLPKEMSAHNLVDFLNKNSASPLRNFILWDLYTPQQEPIKKLTLRFFYQKADRTLQTEEVELFHEGLKSSCLLFFNGSITTG